MSPRSAFARACARDVWSWSGRASERWTIIALATLGVVLPTVTLGYAFFCAARLLGAPLDLIDCFVFGALIAPTDPIAALGLLGRAKVSGSLLTTIAGEALLNDGTGVVVSGGSSRPGRAHRPERLHSQQSHSMPLRRMLRLCIKQPSGGMRTLTAVGSAGHDYSPFE